MSPEGRAAPDLLLMLTLLVAQRGDDLASAYPTFGKIPDYKIPDGQVLLEVTRPTACEWLAICSMYHN